MNTFADQVPVVVSIAFLIAFLFPIVLIANLTRNTAYGRKRNAIILFYLAYLVLVTLMCFSGVFNVVVLPPRIIVVTTLPLLLFYLFYISNTSFYKSLLGQIPLSALVRVHIFRLIGGFFLILFFLEQLPKTFAFIAGLGDIITAIGSLFVARTLEKKKPFSKKLTILWNSFGLADILLTSGTAVVLTKLNMETGSQGVDVLTQFPFCFIPAFAPATIIFLHISVFRKIFDKKFR